MDEEVQRRLETLESQITFQEAHIDALLRTMAEQRATLDALMHRIRELDEQIRQLQPAAGQGPQEAPPHY